MIHIKIEENLKKELTEEAKKYGLSLSSYIRMIISQRKKDE